MKSYPIKTISIYNRQSKVRSDDFTHPPSIGSSFAEWFNSLPPTLAAAGIKTLATRMAQARVNGKAVIWMTGAHSIKVGLSRWIIQLIEEGVITHYATNGASLVHDYELAAFGHTSEDVPAGLRSGEFGMTRETAEFINKALSAGNDAGLGAGAAMGRALSKADLANPDLSIFRCCYERGVPCSVHIGVGTDVVHIHESADGAAIGACSLRDFKLLTQSVTGLKNGGVLLNVGSAVILPEVVLKCISINRNWDSEFSGFFGANLDFVQMYRSNAQVVDRVKAIGGDGVALTGHHEIMVPLLAMAVREVIANGL